MGTKLPKTDAAAAAAAAGRPGPVVNARERAVVVGILLLIAAVVAVDVVVDLRQGASTWHVAAEIVAGIAAAAGASYLLRDTLRMRWRLAQQGRDLSAYRAQAEAWQAQARLHVEGLARSIDQQLEQWQLSAAEKEIAFLLLKGLSLKEIAQLRGTGEKTVRAQSASIYAKAGLAGRSELAAFFLEELLVPVVAMEDERRDVVSRRDENARRAR
ncbi:response regulator transcription factor [Lysobacter yangpyeongensis]|uniref:Response regulator transcription factor n=1 Tax=Lysobacter yangpyeongensis TaxID=346182 RepID=A0ABW0SIA4_9GAMM